MQVVRIAYAGVTVTLRYARVIIISSEFQFTYAFFARRGDVCNKLRFFYSYVTPMLYVQMHD